MQAAGATASSDRITQVINAVSAAVERYLGRQLALAQVTTSAPEYYQGTGKPTLHLRRWPIVSVERVRIDGAAITDYDLTADLKRQGMLYRAGLWPIRAGHHPDVTGDWDPSNLRGYPIDVAYTAGYKLPADGSRDLPYDIEEAAIRTAMGILARPVPGLTAERTPGGWSQTWNVETDITARPEANFPAEVVAMLQPYRSRWFA